MALEKQQFNSRKKLSKKRKNKLNIQLFYLKTNILSRIIFIILHFDTSINGTCSVSIKDALALFLTKKRKEKEIKASK